MNLRKNFERLKFDTRMADINLKAGVVTKKELEDQKQKLEDLKEKAINIELRPETRREEY